VKVCQVKPVERRSKKGNEEKQRTVPKGAGASESGRFHSSTGEKYRGEAGKPSALKDACSVCAVRRFEIFLLQTGGTREVFLSYQLT